MTQKRAARSLGGFVLCPPIGIERASDILGQAIPAEAWSRIEAAFARLGDGLDDLRASRLSRKKDDPQGWFALQAATIKDLEAALDRIGRAMTRRGFLAEAEDNHGQLSRAAHVLRLERDLADANRIIVRVLTVVERAKAAEYEVSTEAELRAEIARSVVRALDDADVDVTLSDGRALPDDLSEADLRPVERLLSELEIHVAASPHALARWVRRAMGQNKG